MVRIKQQPMGKIVSRQFADDEVTVQRVKQSNLLLNLDYTTFNEERERLYNRIHKLVIRGDGYFEQNNPALDDTKQDLQELMLASAEYSKAAECYIRCFRDRTWVEDLIS